MTSITDINAQRDAAMAVLTDRLVAAEDLKANGALGLDQTIRSLLDQRAAIAEQAYEGELSDPAMTAALAAMTAATKEMTTVAARMVSATTFISNILGLATASSKVTTALKAST